MNKRKSDIMILNVGGTSFTSSISTLVTSSSYFERRFSDEWRERDPCVEEPIVIDQDPRLFSVLLSYMRLGSIEAEKLTTPVILLAMFFGMDQLLQKVRVIAIRSKFEGGNLALFSAAQAALLVKESDIKKQFASLTMCHSDWVSFAESRGASPPDIVVFVEVQNEDGTVQTLPNCFTFVDALNVLNKIGYTRYEKEKVESDHSYSGFVGRMWFSKLVVDSDVEDMEVSGDPQLYYFGPEITTVRESDGSIPKKYPREFCCIIKEQNFPEEMSVDLSILEADIGNDEKPISFSGPLKLIDDTIPGKSRSVIVANVDSKIQKYNWLQFHGYTTREYDLERAYGEGIEILTRKEDNPNTVSVWSRPMSESS